MRQTWDDGFYVTYEYDASGAMTAIRENGGALLASFGYDDLGRRTRLVRGNGTVTTYGYDGASRLTGLVQDLAGSAWDQSVTLGYNAAGQIASRTGSNDAYAWTGHYNRTASEPVDGLNRVSASGGVSIGYDARGNVTGVGSATYGYDVRDRLIYNSQGQLLFRNPLNELGQLPGINLDHVNGHLATERWSGVNRRYVWGPGTDEPLVWYEGAGTGDRRYLHADERGSIVAVSNDAGNAIAINTYDEYGMPGASNIGRFQYTGQKWLPELGLYDYKARMYSPTLGRFMQTDPIGYGDGLNLYGYVGGDPVNFRDPLGLEADIVITALPCPAGTHREKDQGDARGCVQNITFTIRMVAEFIGGGGSDFSGLFSDDPAPQNKPGCGGESDLAEAAKTTLDYAGSFADAAALGLAGAGVLAIEVPPAAAALETGAAVAKGISFIAGAASTAVNFFQGNYVGATGSALGTLTGLRGAQGFRALGKVNGVSVGAYKAEVAGTAAAQAVARGVTCPK